MNRFFLFFLLILMGSGSLFGQFSIQSQFHTFSNQGDGQEAWPAVSMIEGSAHYWTRLKKYRMEFYPGVLFQSYQIREDDHSFHMGISLPMAIYPLDFVNDCDCPTFSKNAFWFQKGFFVRLTPAWSTMISGPANGALDQLLSASLSLGLDFGLSDLLTISPMAGYQYAQDITASGISGSSLHFGVSLLFRSDY